MVDRMLTEFAVALQRIARAAGFVVGFPKVQCCFGLIAATRATSRAAWTYTGSWRRVLGIPRG